MNVKIRIDSIANVVAMPRLGDGVEVWIQDGDSFLILEAATAGELIAQCDEIIRECRLYESRNGRPQPEDDPNWQDPFMPRKVMDRVESSQAVRIEDAIAEGKTDLSTIIG